jgi:hypothetical protein
MTIVPWFKKETMIKKEKVSLLVLIITVGFFTAVVYYYIMGFLLGKTWPENTFLFRPDVAFWDFYRVLEQSANLNPFAKDMGGFAGGPFGHLVGYMFSAIHIKWLQLCIFFTSFFTVFILMVKHYLYGLKSKLTSYQLLTIFIIVFFTYPVLFAVDRANFDMLVCVFIFLFAFTYIKQKYKVSTIFLSLAIAIKPYTIVFIMVYIFDKRYKNSLLVIFNTIFLTALSLFLFKDGLFLETQKFFSAAFNTASYLAAGGQLEYTSDLYSFFIVVARFIGNLFGLDRNGAGIFLPTYPEFTILYILLAIIAAIYFIIYLWERPQPLWKVMAVLSIIIILLPIASHDYRLIFLLVPMMMYLANDGRTSNDLIIVILLGLLLIPKNYYRIGIAINPLLLIGLLVSTIPGAFAISGVRSTLRFIYRNLLSIFTNVKLKSQTICAKLQSTLTIAETEDQVKQDHFQPEFLRAFFIILGSAILIVIINLIIPQLMKNELNQNIVEKFIAVSGYAPEQVERTQYLVSLIVFPISCFIGWLLSIKFVRGAKK